MFSFSTALLLTSRHMHCRKMQLQLLRAVHLHACIHTTTRGQDRHFTACLALLVVSWMWGASPQGTAAVSAVRSHSISWFMSIHLSSAPGSFQMTRFMFFSYYGWAEIDDSSGLREVSPVRPFHEGRQNIWYLIMKALVPLLQLIDSPRSRHWHIVRAHLVICEL